MADSNWMDSRPKFSSHGLGAWIRTDFQASNACLWRTATRRIRSKTCTCTYLFVDQNPTGKRFLHQKLCITSDMRILIARLFPWLKIASNSSLTGPTIETHLAIRILVLMLTEWRETGRTTQNVISHGSIFSNRQKLPRNLGFDWKAARHRIRWQSEQSSMHFTKLV